MFKPTPIVTITVLSSHAETVGVTEQGKEMKEVGRRKAQKLLFEYAVGGAVVHSERKNGATNIWIFDREAFEDKRKLWEESMKGIKQ